MRPTDREESQGQKPPVLSWRVSSAPSKLPKGRLAKTTLDSTLRHQTFPFHYSRQETAQNASQNAQEELEDRGFQRPQLPKIREITTSLDPFCNLPSPISREDRTLFQCYLLQVPNRVYGTRSDALFSAVNHVSFPIALTSGLTLQWMLIAADGIFVSRQGEDTTVSVLRRKQRAYKTLNECLKKDGGVLSDGVLGGVIMATITESRFLDLDACNAHLKGYEALIRARGGQRRSILACSTTALQMAHVMPYIVCEPSQLDGGLSDTEQVQLFASFMMNEMGYSSVLDPEPSSSVIRLKHAPLVCAALADRALEFYLKPQEARIKTYIDESSTFLSLFLVVLTLWKLDEFPVDAQAFLDRLTTMLHQSAAFDLRSGRPLLTSQGFMWVAFKTVLDFYRGLDSADEVQLIVHALNALRAFRTMTFRDTRRQARGLLSDIFVGNMPGSILT